MDMALLKEREDKGYAAVHDLRPCEKWAALQVLLYDLNLRPLTQVDVTAEKIRALKRETVL